MPTRYTKVSNSILDAVHDTPLLELEEGIFAKCEFLNPSGSIKARIASYIIERAEKEGLLKPGDTIVEATSGNTGNAFSMVAAVKGYRMIVIMPEGLTSERVAISRAYGAEVLLSGNFHVNEALDRARELGAQPGFFFPGQFESEWNVQENREILGPEILAQLPEGRTPDAFVHGVGTGGTLIGVGQAFRTANPDVHSLALYRSTSGGAYELLQEGLAPSALEWVDATAQAGVEYSYALEAVDASGNRSERSEPVTGSAFDITPPAPVQGVNAALGEDGVSISWTGESGLGYVVERARAGSDRFLEISGVLPGSGYVDAGGKEGDVYRVLAVSASGVIGAPCPPAAASSAPAPSPASTRRSLT